MPRIARKLPLWLQLAYGAGSMAEGIKNAAFNTFVLFYYNQVLGVSGTLTGAVLFVALMVDAVTDPLAGVLSDRHRSRFGRRHPFMAASMLPFALCLWAVFNPPQALTETGLALWLLATAVGVRLGLTLFHVPHLALGAELAEDYDARTGLFAIATLLAAIGGYGAAFIAYGVFFPSSEAYAHGLLNPDAYGPFSVAAALAVGVSVTVCVLGTARQIPLLRTLAPNREVLSPARFLEELRSVFANPSYRSIFFGLLLGTVVVGVEAAFQTYMGVHFWGLSSEQLQLLVLGIIAGLPFSVVLAPLFTRLFDKRGALVGSAAITIILINTPILLRLADVLPANGDPLILALVVGQSFVAGMFGPVILITINSMFADIADEQELRLGRRQEGVIYAARSFCSKVASAAGTFLGGIGLDLIAFPRGAEPGAVDADVIFRLGIVYGPATSFFTFCGLLLYLGYRLDRQRLADIHATLAARSAAAPLE